MCVELFMIPFCSLSISIVLSFHHTSFSFLSFLFTSFLFAFLFTTRMFYFIHMYRTFLPSSLSSFDRSHVDFSFFLYLYLQIYSSPSYFKPGCLISFIFIKLFFTLLFPPLIAVTWISPSIKLHPSLPSPWVRALDPHSLSPRRGSSRAPKRPSTRRGPEIHPRNARPPALHVVAPSSASGWRGKNEVSVGSPGGLFSASQRRQGCEEPSGRLSHQ